MASNIKLNWRHETHRSDARHNDYDAVVLSLDQGAWRGVLTGPGLSENPIKCSASTREIMLGVVEARLEQQVEAMALLNGGGQ